MRLLALLLLLAASLFAVTDSWGPWSGTVAYYEYNQTSWADFSANTSSIPDNATITSAYVTYDVSNQSGTGDFYCSARGTGSWQDCDTIPPSQIGKTAGSYLDISFGITGISGYGDATADVSNVRLYVTYIVNTAPTNGTVSPASGYITTGAWTTVTFSASDADGYGNIGNYQLLMHTGVTYSGACTIHVEPNNNRFQLLNDGGGGYGFMSPGSGQNDGTYCSIRGSGSSFSNSGNTSTVTVSIKFNDNFAGARNEYLNIWDASSASPGWEYKGVVTINRTPFAVGASGLAADLNIGYWQTVTATVRDPDGYGDIDYWHLLMNYGVDGYWACYFLVAHRGNYFHLLNDDGSSWGGGITFGTANPVQNSSCYVDTQNSSVTNSGTDSTVSFRLYFKPGVFSRPSRPQAVIYSYIWVWDWARAGQTWTGAYTSSTARSGPKLIVTSLQ